jgi:hypothetical protein
MAKIKKNAEIVFVTKIFIEFFHSFRVSNEAISCPIFFSGGKETNSFMEYLDPKDPGATWRLKNESGVLAGKYRHCLVALQGLYLF